MCNLPCSSVCGGVFLGGGVEGCSNLWPINKDNTLFMAVMFCYFSFCLYNSEWFATGVRACVCTCVCELCPELCFRQLRTEFL